MCTHKYRTVNLWARVGSTGQNAGRANLETGSIPEFADTHNHHLHHHHQLNLRVKTEYTFLFYKRKILL